MTWANNERYRKAQWKEQRERDTRYVGHEASRIEKLRCVECGDKVFSILEGNPYCSHCVWEIGTKPWPGVR